MFQRIKKLLIIHVGYWIYLAKIQLHELRCRVLGHTFSIVKPEILPEKYNKDTVMASIRHKGIFFGISGDIYVKHKNTVLKHCTCGKWQVDIV